jgi:hypothetical protein
MGSVFANHVHPFEQLDRPHPSGNLKCSCLPSGVHQTAAFVPAAAHGHPSSPLAVAQVATAAGLHEDRGRGACLSFLCFLVLVTSCWRASSPCQLPLETLVASRRSDGVVTVPVTPALKHVSCRRKNQVCGSRKASQCRACLGSTDRECRSLRGVQGEEKEANAGLEVEGARDVAAPPLGGGMDSSCRTCWGSADGPMRIR